MVLTETIFQRTSSRTPLQSSFSVTVDMSLDDILSYLKSFADEKSRNIVSTSECNGITFVCMEGERYDYTFTLTQ